MLYCNIQVLRNRHVTPQLRLRLSSYSYSKGCVIASRHRVSIDMLTVRKIADHLYVSQSQPPKLGNTTAEKRGGITYHERAPVAAPTRHPAGTVGLGKKHACHGRGGVPLAGIAGRGTDSRRNQSANYVRTTQDINPQTIILGCRRLGRIFDGWPSWTSAWLVFTGAA